MSIPNILPVPFSGATVVGVREATAAEMRGAGWGDDWHERPTVVVLDTGTVLIPSQDREGNGPGALLERTQGEVFDVFVARKVKP